MNKVLAVGLVVLLLFAGGYLTVSGKLNDSYAKIPTGESNGSSEPSGWFGVDIMAHTSDGKTVKVPLSSKPLFFLHNPSNPDASIWLSVTKIDIIPSVYFDSLPYDVTVTVRSVSVFLQIDNAQKELKTITCTPTAVTREKSTYHLCNVEITESDMSAARSYLGDDKVSGELIINAVVQISHGSDIISHFSYQATINVAFMEQSDKGDINLPRPPYPVPYPMGINDVRVEVIQ